MCDNPGLYFAHQLRLSEDEYLENSLQARLLAGSSFEEIAEKTGLLRSTVEWYEALFFNVADRVKDKTKYRDWVVRQILGPAVSRGFHERTFDVTAKLFAYFSGIEAAEIVLHVCQATPGPVDLADNQRFLDATFMHNIRRSGAMNAVTLDVNSFNIMNVFELQTKLQEIEIARQNMSGPIGEYEKQVVGLLSEIQWCVGDETEEVWKQTPLAKLRKTATELRADEMMALASGQLLEADVADITGKPLPPPRRKNDENVTPS